MSTDFTKKQNMAIKTAETEIAVSAVFIMYLLRVQMISLPMPGKPRRISESADRRKSYLPRTFPISSAVSSAEKACYTRTF